MVMDKNSYPLVLIVILLVIVAVFAVAVSQTGLFAETKTVYQRSAPPGGYGDLDGDGYVTVYDESTSSIHENDVFLLVAFYDEYGPWDVNQDGVCKADESSDGDVTALSQWWMQEGDPFFVRGDVSCDGVVDLGDIMVVGKYNGTSQTAAGTSSRISQITQHYVFPYAPYEARIRGDVNNDSVLDIQDALLINQYARGEIDRFPVQPEENKPPSPVLDSDHWSSKYTAHRVYSGETVTFDAAGSTDPDGSVVEYRWIFETGATPSYGDTGWITDATIERSWTCTNTKLGTVTLKVRDNDGASASVTEDLEIVGPTGDVDLFGRKRGEGDGYIMVDDSRIDFDSNDEWSAVGYSVGDTVTIEAHPDSVSQFSMWVFTIFNQDGSVAEVKQVSQNPFTFTLDDTYIRYSEPFVKTPLQIDAHIDKKTVTLTRNTVGSGSISVEPYWSSEGYEYGMELTLTAVPASGWIFDHWEGDVSTSYVSTASNNPVTITMNSDKTVTAYFRVPEDYTLTTHSDPVEGGTVQANPTGGTYSEGTSVTLTATPNKGYTFDHWSGDVSGSSSSVTITMNADKAVTAHFDKEPSGWSVWTILLVSLAGIGTVGIVSYSFWRKP